MTWWILPVMANDYTVMYAYLPFVWGGLLRVVAAEVNIVMHDRSDDITQHTIQSLGELV